MPSIRSAIITTRRRVRLCLFFHTRTRKCTGAEAKLRPSIQAFYEHIPRCNQKLYTKGLLRKYEGKKVYRQNRPPPSLPPRVCLPSELSRKRAGCTCSPSAPSSPVSSALPASSLPSPPAERNFYSRPRPDGRRKRDLDLCHWILTNGLTPLTLL